MSEAIDRALEAYALLEERAEVVEDETQYVVDLTTAWRARLEAVRVVRGGQSADAEVEMAIAAVAEEAELVVDPHRAIDWLSTLPQVVLAAVSEPT